jgi:GDP/UDP-N,N'-diacetylbacillosamine 2-epimerase (hydrolysing)
MKKICIISTCRADFGYLYFIMKDIEASDKLKLQIAYPYTHHCREEIWNEFTDHNNHVVLGDMDSIYDIGQFFDRCLEMYNLLKPDMVVILGDRFEVHAAATAALLLNIPIAHIAGGETTLGAFDNELRNSITQMSTYHFTATKDYAEKVGLMLGIKPIINYLEMNPHLPNPCTWDWCEAYDMWLSGEDWDKYYPDQKINVFNVGSPALDWLTRAKLLSKDALQPNTPINLDQPFIVACFHPVTKELERTKHYIVSFLTAIAGIDEQVILIQPNCDPENKQIRESIQYLKTGFDIKDDKRLCVADNLDHLTYLSLLQYAEMMVGNSSSGVIESASFNLPSVTVGNRQDGRIKPGNVISCPCETDAILTAMGRAREWKATVGKCENPYGDGHSSARIVKILEGI